MKKFTNIENAENECHAFKEKLESIDYHLNEIEFFNLNLIKKKKFIESVKITQNLQNN